MSKTANTCLLIVALMHLGGDMVSPGDSVLCIGSDGHRAVEVEHVNPHGKLGPELATRAEVALTAPAADCADQTLHAGSEEILSQRVDGSSLERARAGTSVVQLAPTLDPRPHRALAAIGLGRLPESLRAQRTIVLLV